MSEAKPDASDRYAPLPKPALEIAQLAVAIRDVLDMDDDEEGQVALACAILNRIRRFGPGGEGSGGASARVGIWDVTDKSFCRAFAVACLVLSGDIDDPTSGATHFHRHAENPKWARRATPKALIGRHLFYAIPDSICALL
jgi:hypothetical protein